MTTTSLVLARTYHARGGMSYGISAMESAFTARTRLRNFIVWARPAIRFQFLRTITRLASTALEP